MDEKLVKELIELKVRYFGSKYFSLDNWINFNNITLPNGVTVDDISEWSSEKQTYLAKSKVELDGIRSAYEQIIVDRLDSAAAVQEKIMTQLKEIETSKDLKEVALAMEKVAGLQDEAMKILKVDAYRSNLYEKNKTATEDLLKENSKDV